MITCVIKDDGEPRVIQLTYENLWRELKDVVGAELVVTEDWLSVVDKVKNNYICFVEADCLVSSGYFASQLGLFEKNRHFRKLAALASATGVNNWANRVYGYSLGNNYSDGIVPNLDKKSSQIYPVQIGYMPGAIVRVAMLKKTLGGLKLDTKDLVQFSTELSLAFWKQGDGNRVHINPNTTYVTTENYVNDVGKFEIDANGLLAKFEKESI